MSEIQVGGMRLLLDLSQPLYEQIVDQVRSSIAKGDIALGEKIPSVREMAQALKINPNTVMRTYDFLQNKGKFKETSIDEENDDDKGNGTDEVQINEMDVLQLKNNVIPKGLIPLEELFDQDDVARKPTLQPIEKGVEEVNVRTTANPKMVKLSKALPRKIKDKYISLMSSFADVFAWDYSNLKTYDTNIIQHTIPIKPNQKPFRQKLRRLNPKPMP